MKLFDLKKIENFHWKLYENENRKFSISKFFEVQLSVVITFFEIDKTFRNFFIDRSKIVWKDRKSIREQVIPRFKSGKFGEIFFTLKITISALGPTRSRIPPTYGPRGGAVRRISARHGAPGARNTDPEQSINPPFEKNHDYNIILPIY